MAKEIEKDVEGLLTRARSALGKDASPITAQALADRLGPLSTALFLWLASWERSSTSN